MAEAICGGRLMFQLRSGTLAGNLGTRFLYCMIRPGKDWAVPPAGDYEILPPRNDPIYGRFAVMVRSGSGGGTRLGSALACATAGAAVATAVGFADSTAAGQIFVLSGGQVSGRNNIIFSSGFPEFMDALQTGGGARVTVA